MLVKFESYGPNYMKFWVFWQKNVYHSAFVTYIWRNFDRCFCIKVKQLHDAKLKISIFHISPKINGNLTHVTRLKVAVNVADSTCLLGDSLLSMLKVGPIR